MAHPQPVLIAGEWRDSRAAGTFEPTNPRTREPTGETYPVSGPEEVAEAVEAAASASEALQDSYPAGAAAFLEAFADRIEARAGEIVAMAETETALPAAPRLAEIELPRTTGQLRQAAAAALGRSWSLPTIDTGSGIRSMYRALEGGVAVFGPNNFPLAFNSVSGGDFAAAVGAGCPVIAKGNSSHPGTTRLLAEEALRAVREAGLPEAAVQLIYRTDHEVGKGLVSHPMIGATGYTGSRSAGLTLKAAADAAGKPIYLELSSVNPVYVLPGAIRERGSEIAEEFQTSCLMGTGQFCTNPGIVVLLAGDESEGFIAQSAERFDKAPVGTLLAAGVESGMEASVRTLQAAGAELVTGGDHRRRHRLQLQQHPAADHGAAGSSPTPRRCRPRPSATRASSWWPATSTRPPRWPAASRATSRAASTPTRAAPTTTPTSASRRPCGGGWGASSTTRCPPAWRWYPP